MVAQQQVSLESAVQDDEHATGTNWCERPVGLRRLVVCVAVQINYLSNLETVSLRVCACAVYDHFIGRFVLSTCAGSAFVCAIISRNCAYALQSLCERVSALYCVWPTRSGRREPPFGLPADDVVAAAAAVATDAAAAMLTRCGISRLSGWPLAVIGSLGRPVRLFNKWDKIDKLQRHFHRHRRACDLNPATHTIRVRSLSLWLSLSAESRARARLTSVDGGKR
jgi:hypothetical protein